MDGSRKCKGKVILVGGGPGDPELVTVKGLKAIRSADAIVYDRLAPHELVKEARRDAFKIYVGKRPGEGVPQDEINRILESLACRGLTTVRLKGGDPFTYGRGEEECIYLSRRGIECVVIPGIPSYVAASALHGIPLTSRGVSSSFAVVPGMEAEGKPEGKRVRLEEVARAVDTIVILMGASRSAILAEKLMKVLPPDTPVAIAMDVSLPTSETIITTLEGLKRLGGESKIRSPAVIIVGESVKLRELLKRKD